MSTHPGKDDPAKEQVETEVHGEGHTAKRFDLGFFRRYRKPILYSAGFFALLTFSISGPMLAAFQDWTHSGPPLPTMVVGTKTVKVHAEDYEVGRVLSTWSSPVVVLPRILDEESRNQDVAIWAALRRLALHAGIEASEDEADRAIAQAIKVLKLDLTPAQMALGSRFSSLTQFRQAVVEAMRVSTYLRLQALGVDISDAELAATVRKEQQMITLQVATYDKKVEEKQLKEAGVKDDELKAWLEGLSEGEKFAYQDTNRVGVRVAGVSLGGEFDPAEWSEELKGKTYSEEMLQQRYAAIANFRWPLPAPASRPDTQSQPTTTQPASQPTLADEKVKALVTRELQAEDALRAVWGKVQEDMANSLRAVVEARTQAGEALAEARKKQVEAQKAFDTKKDQLDAKTKAEWAASEKVQQEAIDAARRLVEDKQKALTTAKDKLTQIQKDAWQKLEKELNVRLEKQRQTVEEERRAAASSKDRSKFEAAKKVQEELEKQIGAGTAVVKPQADELEAAKKDLEAKEKVLAQGPAAAKAEWDALEAAKKDIEAKTDAQRDAEFVVDDARKRFDMLAAFTTHGKARKGLKTATVVEARNAEGLKEVPGFAKWLDSANAISIDTEGDLATQLQHSEKWTEAFFFQVTHVTKRPLKPFAEIKDKLTSDYVAKKADELATTKGQTFVDTLLRLAKEARKDEVAKIEKEQNDALDKKLRDQADELRAKISKADQILKDLGGDTISPAYVAWKKAKDDAEKSLADETGRRQQLVDAQKQESEDKIKAEAKKAYKDVLEAAATTSGFIVRTFGPHPRKLSSFPRFADRFDEATRFLFARAEVSDKASGLKEGEASELLDDPTGRAKHLVICTKLEEATLEQLTRRQILQERSKFIEKRLEAAVAQSFTLEALKKRYQWSEPK